MKSWTQNSIVLAALATALAPLFFTIDRVMVFNAMPRDDYAPFLMWLVGAPGGALPASPYAYRVLTMVAAVPFYYGLPPLRFSNLPSSLTPQYVQATAAIAALSYLSLILAALLAYRIARDRCGLLRREAVLAGAVLFLLALHSQIFGIDSFAILLITAGLYLLPNAPAFTVLIVLSVWADEKVAIVFAIWLTLRCIFCSTDRRMFRAQWVATLAALALYGAGLLILRLPGNAYQLDPGDYLVTLLANLRAMVSVRGLLLNILPVAVLLCVAVLGLRSAGDRHVAPLFRSLDLLVIPSLVLVALILTQMYQMGRIVMHAAPLYAVPAAVAIGRWMDMRATDTSPVSRD